MTTSEKWVVTQRRADYPRLHEELKLDPLTLRVLANRGLTDAEAIRAYMQPDLQTLHEPALLRDADKAAALLEQAIRAGQSLAIASDYDVDGIFAGQVLKRAFTRLGAAARVFTPDRVTEGYGLNRRIVDDACAWGAGLLITCDNGIAAHDAVSYAKERGLTVIVTDHHEVPRSADSLPDLPREENPDLSAETPSQSLPPADAVVDPKRSDCAYPFDGICGAVVAWKVVCLLYRRLLADPALAEAEQNAFLPLIAIATVADVMDLADENRAIVSAGLKALACTDDPGLLCLIRACGLEGKALTPYHIGFILGPCFNAAGRLDTVAKAHALLDAQTQEEAEPIARALQELNEERKRLTNQGLKAAQKAIEEEGLAEDAILVVWLPDCHESVAGIIAGRLKEQYNRPALVITGEGPQCKGSGRSIPPYHMYNGLDECREELLQFGGHPMAAGFSIKKDNIFSFRRQINAKSHLTDEDLCPIIRLDAVVPLGYVSYELLKELEQLAPFGKGNEKPLFGRSGLTVTQARVLGQNRNAVRLSVTEADGTQYDAIWFGDADRFAKEVTDALGEKAFTALERRQKPIRLAIAYEPTVSEYEGRRSIRFLVHHYQILR